MPLSVAESGPLPTLGSIRIAACGENDVGPEWSVWERGPYRTWNHTVYHILDGGCTLAFDGGEWHLGPGSIHIIPGHRFARRRTRRMHHRWINFNLDRLSTDLHLGRIGRPLTLPLDTHRPWVDALAEAARLGAALVEHPEAAPPYSVAAIEGLLLQVVAIIGAHVGPPAADFGDEVLRTALAYLERHFRRMPSLGEVARACRRSPNHLHSIFTRAFGASPTVYARSCRMRDAVHLLISSAIPVQEVARRCGYEDPLHFSRVFSRQFGCSPSAVRHQPERSARAWTALDRTLAGGAPPPRGR